MTLKLTCLDCPEVFKHNPILVESPHASRILLDEFYAAHGKHHIRSEIV